MGILFHYLRQPAFANGEVLEMAGGRRWKIGRKLATVIEDLFALPETCTQPIDTQDCSSESQSLLKDVLGRIELDIAQQYDVIVVEQGYGGVFVHAVDLVAQLRLTLRVLFLAPGDPFFGAGRHADDLTIPRLREKVPGLSYFAYVNILRAVVATVPSRLLLITHRSQSIYLFDLLAKRNTVIYCDGYFDAGLTTAAMFPTGTRPSDRRILREIMYVLGNSAPQFWGLMSSPRRNSFALWAGYIALRAARENWCWGVAQRDAFACASNSADLNLRIQLPFICMEIFRPKLVKRSPVLLFTTTMHNIDKKGIEPIINALHDTSDLMVSCVVRQPERLPRIPFKIASRLRIQSLSKAAMMSVYHEVWANCRLSTEESSPISVLESMACEVPQIVSPVVARQIPFLEDGVTGYVVEPDDRVRLKMHIDTLMKSPGLRNEMGVAARQRVQACSTSSRTLAIEALLAPA
jgi:hypothetical protein